MAANIDLTALNLNVPDFTAISLSDDEHISKALDIILAARNKSMASEQLNIWIENISNTAKGDNVGCLRALQETEWKQLDIPLICRIYLKHLILQSQCLNKQQLLECDFNGGLNYEYSTIQDTITQILHLGFSRNEALEAIIVTNNENIDAAFSYLLSDNKTRKIEYERAKNQRNQNVPPNHHWTVIERNKKEEILTLHWQQQSENVLLSEIEKLKQQSNEMREKRQELEIKNDRIIQSTKLTLYKEYIRGLIAYQYIIPPVFIAGYIREEQSMITQLIPDEIQSLLFVFCGYIETTINIGKMEHMERYRNQRKITDDDDMQVLRDLGYDTASFEKLKTYEYIDDDELGYCVISYSYPADHMVIPCNHVCLCCDCAECGFPAPHHGQQCPLCSIDIQDIKQIFYF